MAAKLKQQNDELTPLQEQFAREVASGKTLSDAFRASYGAKNSSNKTINERACAIMATPKVQARVEQLRLPAAQAAGMTLQGHLERLAELAQLAAEAGQYSAAVLAETNRGKAVGYYTQRIEATISHPTSIIFALDNDIEDAELIDG